MKERKTRKYLIILLGIVMILIGTGSYFYIKKMPKVTLTEEVDMPIPGKPGSREEGKRWKILFRCMLKNMWMIRY